MSFTQTLAAFATDAVTTTPVVRRVTALSVLDWLSVGRAGAAEPVSRIVRDMALAEQGAALAHVFGSDVLLPARVAALVNGTTSHALDYDDTHFAHIGHPSVAVIPAALAVAEQQDTSLVDLQEAALVGMELSIRLGLWLGRSHYQAGFHQTATAGAFGAAAAAGRLLGFDTRQMQEVLGLAATRAAGLKAQFGTMGKPYNAGLAASCGVEVALLVQRGFISNPSALEGPFGFLATHQGTGETAEALQDLGQDWLMEGVSHKFHACCHGLHAVLEAARDLDLAEPEIAEMTVHTHPRWMSVCNQPAPRTGLEAKFSYTTVLAMRALGYDTARLESYSDAICADPRLTSLRDRITVIADDALSETEARLSVLRRNGTRAEATYDLAAPLSLEDRELRVRKKAHTLIGAETADLAWSLLREGDSAQGFGSLVAAMA